MSVRVVQEIDRPPEDVWAYVGTNHVENHPKWDPAIQKLELVGPGPIGKGSRMRMERKDPGMHSTVDIEITEFEPNRRFAFVGTAQRMDFSPTMTIQPRGAQGSRLTMEADMQPKGPFKLMFPLMKPMIGKQLRDAMARIKDGVEAGPRSTPQV